MATANDSIYRFAPLDEYSLSKRVQIRALGFLMHWILRGFGMTLRCRTFGEENLQKAEAGGRVPIYAIWHHSIVSSTYMLRGRGIGVLGSHSFDAEYTARVIQKFGFGSIRGSSSKGGARGMLRMIRAMKAGVPMGFTADGPRGPRHEAKSGAVFLAGSTGNALLPMTVEPEKYWQLNSWDKLKLPKPFSRAALIYGEPIFVDKKAGEDIIEAKRQQLEKSLNELEAIAPKLLNG